MGGGDQLPRDDFYTMTDKKLDEFIVRQRYNIADLGPKLPDKGEKLKATLKRAEDAREKRKQRKMAEDREDCKRNPHTGASDGFRQGTTTSRFAQLFSRKLDETDGRTVNAFEDELSCLTPCGRRSKITEFSLQKDQQKSGLSLREKPFQDPFTISIDKKIISKVDEKGRCSSISSPQHLEEDLSESLSKRNTSQVQQKCGLSLREKPFQDPFTISIDKKIISKVDEKGRRSSISSPRHLEEDLPESLSKRNTSQVQSSHKKKLKNEQNFVLVDEDESEVMTPQKAGKADDILKDITIYYPSRGDPESIEIIYPDLECLDPRAYLSSTIMNFYIRYLQQPTFPGGRTICDYHFFNTYFYKKLNEAILSKGDKETSFAKFRRWWKGVNLFEKSYILLPVHENLHWSLVIISIPDKEEETPPIILHLDSLGLHYSKSIFKNIKSFLKEEWNYLRGESHLEPPIANQIWQHLPRRIDEKIIEVPQQKNEYDCGLFVLFFMKRFVEEAPCRMKKQNLKMFGRQWFRPEEASNLRQKIRSLLVKEFKKEREGREVVPSRSQSQRCM